MQKEITLSDLKQMMAELVLSRNETKDLFKETKELFKETDRKFKESTLESEKSRIELDKRFAKTTKHINQVLGKFDSQWGKLMESLVEGDLIKIFKERGIEVHDTSTRIDGNFKGQNYEPACQGT